LSNRMSSASDVAKEKEMLKRDLYKELGIERTATEKEIKKAYRNKARDVHPDKNPSPEAAAVFHKLKEAFDFLKEPQNRAKLDMHLDNWRKQQERTEAMDSVLREKRSEMDKREAAAEERERNYRKKTLNRAEQIKRLRAEGQNLLEKAQAQYRVNKRKAGKTEDLARLRVSWDHEKFQFSASELKKHLGACGCVLSTKKNGVAAVEFYTMQQAVAAEFAAKRVFQCPLEVKWLSKQPTNYAESREKARQKTYSSKQVRDFEAYQEHVLRRCEGLSV